MYFPVGWPTVLKSNSTTSGHPVKLLRHRTKNYVIELREHSVAFWQSRLHILVSSYVRSVECVQKHGPNLTAALKPDGTVIVIATTKGHLLFLRVQYDQFSPDNQIHYSTREHGILHHHGSQFEGSGEGRHFESVSIKYFTETAVVGGIYSLVNVSSQLLVATGYGVLHRLSWEGKFDGSLLINLSLVPFANDLLPETRGTPLGDSDLHAVDLAHSPDMHGFSIVLSDGRGAFLTSRSSRYEPQDIQAVWIPRLTGAVCTAANGRYRLIAFGKEDGSVEVYCMDDNNGQWSLSHTLKFSRSQFPDTGVKLGRVESVQWSVSDGMVIAVAWNNGGLSLWTVFGSLLLCSLGDQPGTPSPLNPHCTVLQSMCWSSDGYHLWMLPRTANEIHSLRKIPSSEKIHEGNNQSRVCCHDNGGQVIVMKFMRNAIVDNPISANHSHLFLLGSDRLYLNLCKNTNGGVANYKTTPSETSSILSPQWKVIQYPSSYLALNWPVKYAAVNNKGSNLVISGKAGFAIYSGSRRKWKLFGNEVQEQSLVCRGGLLWFEDVVVFPCRVQEHHEEVRFYSLHSNLDNSQLLKSLKTTSPIVRLNLHGNHLLLASRDCHMTILGLDTSMVPNKGLVLTVTNLHEVSLAQSLSQPWANTLISMIPSNIRTEPVTGPHRTPPHTGTLPPSCSIDSVLFNISGRLLMLQQEVPNMFKQENKDTHDDEKFSFSSPVCLAGSVEALWTPPYHCTCDKLVGQHLMESLWLACGVSGIKVWLPLYPRDEGHPTFLSKRIMLTLPITVYPQVILFSDAIMFGLSHETAFTDSANPSRHCFPFATIERTTHVFLHHIMRQLLRRNLGSHALQMARSSSHLPYFRHVLELMLHEILEEEAPRSRSMPVPDALLPGVVEFIKQFPEFLETVGHCARKTEIALWQYLFAAVGNPRDLFELSLSDGSLSTAATYLIIIQNLEAPAVSRQLATKLLDAALDTNKWELCKDLVRFLKAIGPGDTLDSSLVTMVTTPGKTPTQPLSLPLSTEGESTPLSAAPDLDRSAMSITRDHLSSGSVSSVVSLSGEYKDASGRVIRRPQFVMDVDSKEDYFIELILCRHARKLLTTRCLRDLGRFTAHLEFNFHTWLVKERLRAARIDDFVTTLREMHREFQWPFPLIQNDRSDPYTLSPASTVRGQSPQETPNNLSPTTPTKRLDTTLTITEGEVPSVDSPNDNDTVSSLLKRANRPPDLDLTPAHAVAILRTTAHGQSVNLDPIKGTPPVNRMSPAVGRPDFAPTRSSTPSRRSGSIMSEKVSLIMKHNSSSADLNAESSSLGDITEESDWEINSVVAMATGGSRGAVRGSTQAEKEIRYFTDVMIATQCFEWSIVLATLLLDTSVISRVMEEVKGHPEVDTAVLTRCLDGYKELCDWADNECPGYSHFLNSLGSHFEQLSHLSQQLPNQHSPKTPGASQLVSPLTSMNIHEDLSLTDDPLNQTDGSLPTPKSSNENESACILS